MRNKDSDELKELLHWLAYTYPGIYKLWCDKKDHERTMWNLNRVVR